jgi:rhodanese-related sulfurtransferase
MKAVFLEQFARVGKAISSPSRLELLDLLCQSEKSVETLVSQSGLTLKNASAQLRVMREAGLITSRRDGKYIYYRISDRKVADFWSEFQKFSRHQLAELQTFALDLTKNTEEIEQVGRKTLLARAKRGEVVVIDVRPPDEYEAGHLPFALSVPLNELESKLKRLPKNKRIVAHCRGPYCLMAVEAVKLLNRKGFDAQRLDLGVNEWSSAGFPVVKTNHNNSIHV